MAGDEISTVQKLCEQDRVVDPCAVTEVSSADHRTRGALPWIAKAEHLYRVLPNNRSELIEAVKSYRQFYNYERLHMSLVPHTSCGVFKQGRPSALTYPSGIRVRISGQDTFIVPMRGNSLKERKQNRSEEGGRKVEREPHAGARRSAVSARKVRQGAEQTPEPS